MNDTHIATIILYTSNFCRHALQVEQLFTQHEIPVTIINISHDPAARQTLINLNGGYASVPTLIFPDGSILTEPSLRQVKARLGIEEKGVLKRVQDWIGND